MASLQAGHKPSLRREPTCTDERVDVTLRLDRRDRARERRGDHGQSSASLVLAAAIGWPLVFALAMPLDLVTVAVLARAAKASSIDRRGCKPTLGIFAVYFFAWQPIARHQLRRWQHAESPRALSRCSMKIVTLAVVAATLASFALPTFAEARTMNGARSHHMMMRGHHMMMRSHRRMHMMGRSGGRMPGHRTF